MIDPVGIEDVLAFCVTDLVWLEDGLACIVTDVVGIDDGLAFCVIDLVWLEDDVLAFIVTGRVFIEATEHRETGTATGIFSADDDDEDDDDDADDLRLLVDEEDDDDDKVDLA